VIGYVLVFSIVAITIGIVSVAGVSTLQNAKDVEQTRNVERAFDVLADNLEDLRIAGAPNRATEVSLNEATLDTATTATVNLTGWNGAGSNFTAEATSDVIAWQSTRGSPTRIVYAFGTVLRSQRDGGIITRAGPFQFDTDRTIVPLVQTRTRSAQSLGGGTIRVRAGRSVPTIQHRGDASMYSNLWLNVTTSHAHTWHQYLDDQTGTNCSIRAGPGSKETVTCELDGRDELYVTIHPVNIELER
jgi:type II secretory pathway pseudopilin PulG